MLNINFNFRKPKTVYISHIEQENIVADSLKLDLKALGYDVISTPHQKGEQYLKAMCPKIVETADAVVVLKSPSSSRSQRVWADIGHARLHGVPVIPMVVHQFEDNVPVHFHISAVDNFEDGVKELRDALKQKHQFKQNEVGFTYTKHVFRKTVVAAAIMVLTVISALLP